MRRGSDSPSPSSSSPTKLLLPYVLFLLLSTTTSVLGHVYNATLDPWNINKNQQATDVLDYTTTRKNTTYTQSPANWRALPAYTILLDKWIDGEPDNNDFYGMIYEFDMRETQLRTGGDAAGLMDPRGLDYLQGLGYQTIYIAGTNFVNMPWQSDGEWALRSWSSRLEGSFS